MQRAAATWNAAGAHFSFNYAGTTSVTAPTLDGVNEIMWSDLGGTSRAAHTTCWFTGGIIEECDMELGDHYSWSTASSPASGEADVESVALHEFGHFLALDHVDDPSSVMYPSYILGTTKRSLGLGDTAGIRALYGPTSDKRDVPVPAGAATIAAQKVNYGTGAGPISVAVADFNGDSHPDLVVANRTDGTVSVLLNNGNGTFAPKVHYGTGAGPISVAVADFNGDSYPDLAVATGWPDSAAHTVSILLNNGNGTFAPKVDYTVGSNPESVAVADFNGDSHPDLVVANNISHTASVLLNKGNGIFAFKVDYGTGYYPSSVTAADLNGDSYPDIVVANGYDGTVSVLISATAAGATPTPTPTATPAATPTPTPVGQTPSPTPTQCAACTPTPTPTSTPVGQTPSPTPTPTATPIGQTPSPTPAPTPTPTATPIGQTPSPTPVGTTRTWGGVDCGGDIGPRDAQAILKNVLVQNALSQTQPCPAVGSQVTVDGVSRIWGDVDCSGDIAPRDAQAILKNVLVQNALSQTQPCPAVGSTVQVVG